MRGAKTTPHRGFLNIEPAFEPMPSTIPPGFVSEESIDRFCSGHKCSLQLGSGQWMFTNFSCNLLQICSTMQVEQNLCEQALISKLRYRAARGGLAEAQGRAQRRTKKLKKAKSWICSVKHSSSWKWPRKCSNNQNASDSSLFVILKMSDMTLLYNKKKIQGHHN